MAVDGTYEIEIPTPLGKQTGTCVFKSSGSQINGIYKTTNRDYNFTGTIESDICRAEVTIPSPLGGNINLKFNIKFTLTGLSGTVQLGPFGTAPVNGVKTS